jgi:glycogen debranching enzyme
VAVANGLGGYASGTLAGINTRRYHGLLVAALDPPIERTVLVGGLIEWASYEGRRYALSTQEYSNGHVAYTFPIRHDTSNTSAFHSFCCLQRAKDNKRGRTRSFQSTYYQSRIEAAVQHDAVADRLSARESVAFDAIVYSAPIGG